MTNPYTRAASSWIYGIATVLVGCLCAAFVFSAASDEKRISIYSTVANYSLPVIERNGHDYAGLLEILDPLGTVKAKASHEHWKIRFNDVESDFSAGKTRVRVRSSEFDLPAPFLLEDDRGLVPLSSLPQLLPRILGGPVTFHETARRLFIGSVAVRFAAQINKTIPPSLVLNFSSPVNPTIATEAGKLRMSFKREPLLLDAGQKLNFGDKTIASAEYQEQNGAAEITVNGSAPLFATFSNDGRTITIAPAPRAVTSAAQSVPSAGSNPRVWNSNSSPVSPSGKRYFAVIDAAHGGDDRGAILDSQLAEKDVTLALARRLQQELESRGMPALLLRNDDGNVPDEKRASMTNSIHPAIYICLHATAQGTSVGIFSALLPSGEQAHGPFVPWDLAQSSFLASSQKAAGVLATEFQANHISNRNLSASLKPLNNITAPAVAIELAPPENGVSGFNSVEYQQLITATIAMGLSEARGNLEANR